MRYSWYGLAFLGDQAGNEASIFAMSETPIRIYKYT